jgi:hypothetical protein
MPNRYLSRLTLPLLAIAGLFASAASAQYSTPMRDVENPARTSFQASATVVLDPPFAGVFGTPLFDVPAGRRAVIEHVSARCSSPSGSPIVQAVVGVTELTPLGSNTRSFQVPLAFQGSDPFVGPLYIGSLTTRLYSDRGSAGGGVTAGAGRANGTGSGSCNFTISGHTIGL